MIATQTPTAAARSRILGISSAELKFRIQGGEHDGRILRIAAAKCTIGSAAGCTLRLGGDGIEPLHCLILAGRNGTVVRRNSPRTYLNGGAFEDAALKTGDVLRIGHVELAVVACPEADSKLHERPQPIQESAESIFLKQEQLRLTAELGGMEETLRGLREELAQARRQSDEASAEHSRLENGLREQFAQDIEALTNLKHFELKECLSREEQIRGELSQSQQSAKELESRFAEREVAIGQELAGSLQQIRTLEETTLAQQEQRALERESLETERQQFAEKLANVEGELLQQSGELGGMEETLKGLREELTQARLQSDEASAEQSRIEYRLREQFAQDMEALRNQQHFELKECLSREEQIRSELNQSQQSAKELESRLAEREVAFGQELAGSLQQIKTLEETIRAQQGHRELERGVTATERQRLTDELVTLQDELCQRETELVRQQEASSQLGEQVGHLEHLLQETQQQAEQRQREQEELTAVRSTLAGTIAELTETLRQREGELDAAHQRGGECAGTLTIALDNALCEFRNLQAQHRQQEGEYATFRGEVEMQVADMTARLVERERELVHQSDELIVLRQKAAHLSAAEQMVKHLEESLATTAHSRQEEREAWQRERNEIECQRNEWETQQTEWEGAHHELKARHEAAENQCNELLIRCGGLETQQSELQAAHGDLQNRCADLESRNNELRMHSSHLEAQGNSWESAYNSLQAEKAALEARQTELLGAHRELEASCDEAESKSRELLVRCAELEAQSATLQDECQNLHGRCSGLESERNELGSQVAQMEKSAIARCEALEGQIAELQASLDQAVSREAAEQDARQQAALQYEQQVERWQSEAHQWQMQTEDVASQFNAMTQRCKTLETEVAELQGALHSADKAAVERQSIDDLRRQLDMQRRDLAEARVQLQEEQSQIGRLLADSSSREEELARFEAELRQRETAFEASRGEQVAALEERSKLVASQIAQFEAEQAAFTRQQATIIQQMSALEDRVQELTAASESRSTNSPFVIPRLNDPSLRGDLEPAPQPYVRAESIPEGEAFAIQDAPHADATLAPTVSDDASPESSDEPAADVDSVMERLIQAGLCKETDQNSPSTAEPRGKEPGPEQTRISPLSFLEQAAELARQEDLAGDSHSCEAKVAPPERISSLQQPSAFSPPRSGNEEDDSIEQYMNRLLSRVRGSDTHVAASQVTAVNPPETAKDVPASNPPAAVETPLEPKEYVPRVQAPEMLERMSLMRELANSAAKSAISTHTRQIAKHETKQKSLVAVLSLIGAAGLFMVACSTGSLIAMAGSMIFVAICCVMSMRAISGGFRQMRLTPPQEVGESQEAVHDSEATTQE